MRGRTDNGEGICFFIGGHCFCSFQEAPCDGEGSEVKPEKPVTKIVQSGSPKSGHLTAAITWRPAPPRKLVREALIIPERFDGYFQR